jgi:2-keto-4-pentenoate hydratase/2-oxohepta-3-ene-1,7-dioic acid hydratase in catechol pathway
MSEHSYRLATYSSADGDPRAGLVIDERVVDVAAALTTTRLSALAPSLKSVLDVLRRWKEVSPFFREVARSVRHRDFVPATLALSSVRLHAPVLYPGTIFCAGANYRDHVLEMSKALNLPPEPDPHELGLKPWHFIKASAPCVRGTGSTIALPAYSSKVDWEAEIAVVIGSECRNVSVDTALQFVAGLTIANDLSARDHLRRAGVSAESPFRFDWVSQKCFDGAMPLGPWICPMDEAGDPGNLGIRLWVNDELMQDSSSSNMIFSMAEQIAHLSTRLTLMPGDVIATGTPAGCGTARGRFLKPGDRVRVWVENIGELSNEFTAPGGAAG